MSVPLASASYSSAHLVPGPGRVPIPFGLFSVLRFRLDPPAGSPPGPARWQNGVTWETESCDPAGGIGDATGAEPTIGLPKDLEPNGAPLGAASPFTVYGHHTCSPVGSPPARAQQRATDHLLAREEARVEQALWTGDLGNEPSFTTAAKVGAGALPPGAGLGLIEQALAATVGLGLIHMSRPTAVQLLALDLLIVSGDLLRTALGTPT